MFLILKIIFIKEITFEKKYINKYIFQGGWGDTYKYKTG